MKNIKAASEIVQEIDSEKPDKRGRGSRNKIPFVAAVETTQYGRLMKIHLRRVSVFRDADIEGLRQSQPASRQYHLLRWTLLPQDGEPGQLHTCLCNNRWGKEERPAFHIQVGQYAAWES